MQQYPEADQIAPAVKEPPPVSAVIPTFNRWPLVCESIDSALRQDYPNLEIIVVDDGSTDDTETELPAHYGEQVQYIRQANQGPSVARNTGIEAATGDYIAFLDSDDLWLPQKLSVQMAALAASPQWAFGYHPCLVAKPDGTPTRTTHMLTHRGVTGDNFENTLRYFPLQTSAVTVRRDVLTDLGGFDPDMLSGQDTDLWLRLTLSHEGVFTPKPLTLIREHRGRWSHVVQPSGVRARAHVHMWKKLLRQLPEDRSHLRSDIESRLLATQITVASIEHQQSDWPELRNAIQEHLRHVNMELIKRRRVLSEMAGAACSCYEELSARSESIADMLKRIQDAADTSFPLVAAYRCSLAGRLVRSGHLWAGCREALSAMLLSPRAAVNYIVIPAAQKLSRQI